MIDNVHVVNSIDLEIEKFIMNNIPAKFNEEVWVAWGYSDVRKVFQDDNIDTRPVYHIEMLESGDSHSMFVGNGDGKRREFEFWIRTVIGNTIMENKKRNYAVNYYQSLLRNIFETKKKELKDLGIMQVMINTTSGKLDSNADNLYSKKQKLRIKVVTNV